MKTVVPTAYAEMFTFAPKITVPAALLHSAAPSHPSHIPATSLPTGKKKILLAAACGPDEKCQCIAHAIFTHDSSWATSGVGKRANNPCNMRVPSSWTPKGIVGSTRGAGGLFAKFDSLESGVHACVSLYRRFYQDLPPLTLVKRWTNGGNPNYRSAVKACYS